ncbi:ubiquitin carboxyl-terminal hydrolase [Hirsutella rhossiliensis]|uniref:ubiquitinyl hydrolase 1 n=1 Tax=Hirsutella rhossiliensis TaxID=111463 RepID=A0A9P8N1I4_9HYPO|nr:ubiquitin carboxyl-terminal hydrolase domain-containing protein [Hirsutella rhossiliensis]KAH0965207.1 ubiquitin carboxyl-terminal hydrolase domain-containing protein [Hirsutella rhossiliensis]
MTSKRSEFSSFYEDRISAHRLPHSRDHVWGRWNEPSVLLSVLAIAITIAFKVYSTNGSLENLVGSLANLVWDCIIFVIPAPLLFALDGRINSSSPRQRTLDDARRSTHAAKREAMSRLIGLDRPGGMLASMSQARTRALSVTGSVLGLKLDFQRPPGLGNRDNSCYQNSILQGLAALHSFSDYLSACVRAVDLREDGSDVAQTLRALLWDLNDPSNNGKTIWTPSLLKSMSTWTQQDAQEYFSKMLDDIDKGVAKAVKATRRYSGLEADCGKDDTVASQHSDDSGYQSLSSSPDLSAIRPLRNPLEGLLAQRVACVACGYAEGLSMIPFNCLTLSLGLDKNRHDLFERLDAYSRVESIEGVECPKCTLLKAQRLLTKLIEKLQSSGAASEQLAEPCRRLGAVETALEEDDFDEKTIAENCKISSQGKVSSTKTKQIVIARPPQSLAIHVNRSVFDPTTFDMIKNSAPVSFPLTLDLGPWCLGSSESQGAQCAMEKTTGDANAGEERWQLGPTASMIAGDLRPSRLTGPIYELRAAVTHAGRHENGHYICYRTYPNQAAAISKDAPGGQVSRDTAIADEKKEADTETDEEETKSSGKSRTGNPGWWRLSDHNVSRVDEGTVLGLSPGVFMLLYECVDPSMMLQSDAESTGDREELLGTGDELVKDEAAAEPMATRRCDVDASGPEEVYAASKEGVAVAADGDSHVDTEDAERIPLPASDDADLEVP